MQYTAILSLILKSYNVCTTFKQIIMIAMPKTVIIIDYKIIHMRTFGLSMQNKGPAIVKLTIFHNHAKTMKNSPFYYCIILHW